jgi:phosphate transport system permease protein
MKKNRFLIQNFWFGMLGLSGLLIAVILFTLIFFVTVRGFRVVNWEFLTAAPKDGMTAGGIFPAIVGTFYLTLLAIAAALPVGVVTAIYLNEYAPKSSRMVRLSRTAINALAGIPSVVFGLFGLALFVNFLHFGVSILSGGLTLAVMILPVIIRSSEEALSAVPFSFREASLALGASKWYTIRRAVLPTALPGIFTGAILGIGRVAGETAPIMFTAATFYTGRLPSSIGDEVMALPYHIYGLMTEGTHPDKQMPIAYGTALVLLILVLGIDLIAILWRYRARKAKKW